MEELDFQFDKDHRFEAINVSRVVVDNIKPIKLRKVIVKYVCTELLNFQFSRIFFSFFWGEGDWGQGPLPSSSPFLGENYGATVVTVIRFY